jgi:glycosyltransferase involved in cell wall biosynthesis
MLSARPAQAPGNCGKNQEGTGMSEGSLKIKLSVIVANYNNEPYIRECLDSILNQTYKNLEIIVSDDYSTDNSPTIILEYEKKYPGVVKGIFSLVNTGVAHTRHKAILQAKAEYLTTLDSDDYYYDHQKLAKEMELIAHYKKKTGKDILAFSNIVLVKADKSVIRIWGSADTLKEGFIFNDIITRTCMIPRDFIMKKRAYFEVGGYDFQFPIYEDWDLKIRLAHAYEFYYTGLKGTGYRRHGKGLSSAPPPEHIKWLNFIFNKNLHLSPSADKELIFQGFQKFINRLGKKK